MFSYILEAGNNKQERQGLLNSIEAFAKVDPAEMGLIHSSIPGLLAFPASISEEIEELFPSLSEAPASVAADLNPGEMGWAKRGNYLNEKIGCELARQL